MSMDFFNAFQILFRRTMGNISGLNLNACCKSGRTRSLNTFMKRLEPEIKFSISNY